MDFIRFCFSFLESFGYRVIVLNKAIVTWLLNFEVLVLLEDAVEGEKEEDEYSFHFVCYCVF